MSDQHDGESKKDGEADATPSAAPDAPLSGRTRAAPVIDSAAVEVRPPETEAEPAESQGAPIEPPTERPAEPAEKEEAAAAEPETAPAAQKPRKNRALRSLAALIGVAVLGAGGYYAWTEFYAPGEALAPIPDTPKFTLAEPASDAPKAESKPAELAAPEKSAPPPAAAEEPKSEQAKPAAPAPVEAPKKAEAPVELAPAASMKGETAEAKPPEAKPPEAKAAEASVESLKTPTADASAEKALAQMSAQLATTQAALERVTQRLQTVEGQLAAPKSNTRAELAAREAGPSGTNDASARIVVAQSLLTALRQGDDYAPQLAALQSVGGDSARIARLRGGLAAPTPGKLAADFVALAPKLAAAAAPQPPQPQPQEAKPSRNLGEAVLSFVETRAQKLVRIRPAGAPDRDETGARIDGIEQKLLRGDIAGALAERALLPAPALALSADWASGAQARLDAEAAAKAELAESLQALSKVKS